MMATLWPSSMANVTSRRTGVRSSVTETLFKSRITLVTTEGIREGPREPFPKAMSSVRVLQTNCQHPRWYDVRAAERRQDVVDPLLVRGVQQVGLNTEGDVVLLQVGAEREVEDGARLHTIRIEVRARVHCDVGNRE